MFRRPLIPLTALFWGLQFAFLSPALALILVSLYHATPAEVGWVLAIYNTGGFLASLAIPGYADRRRDYLLPQLACAVLTLGLAGVLAVVTSLPLVTIALLILGAPAGVGSFLLFAQLRHTGATTAEIVNTRAIFSFAWVIGPPVATALMGWLGDASVLAAIALVSVGSIATILVLIVRTRAPATGEEEAAPGRPEATSAPRGRVAVVFGALVLAQATDAAAVAVMTLFVTQHLGLPVFWAGIALGLAAGLEIPALLTLGRLSATRSLLGLLLVGCAAGVGYFLGMVFVTEPIALLALQPLNALFFASVAGIGLTLFQELIAAPGIATGLFANTRRVGAILSGSLIGLAGAPWGYPGVFAACAALTVIAAIATWAAGRRMHVRSAGSRLIA